MSNRRQDTWSLGTIAAVGGGLAAVAGLGYALYKLSSEEENKTTTARTTPVRNTLSFHSKKCELCKEVFQLNDEIKLLCNHHFHKECLLSAYSRHSIYNSSPFPCPAANCYIMIHKSVIDSLNQQCNSERSVVPAVRRIDALPRNNATGHAALCKLCDRDLIFEKSTKLPCGHEFHENCFAANCVCHLIQRDGFRCPIATCHYPVPRSMFLSLAQNFATK